MSIDAERDVTIASGQQVLQLSRYAGLPRGRGSGKSHISPTTPSPATNADRPIAGLQPA